MLGERFDDSAGMELNIQTPNVPKRSLNRGLDFPDISRLHSPSQRLAPIALVPLVTTRRASHVARDLAR